MSSAQQAMEVAGARYREWELLPAEQQPDWLHHPRREAVVRELSAAQPLVSYAELVEVEQALARVAHGSARLLQAGDCVESLDESGLAATAAKIGMLDRLADRLARRTGQEVVRVGRLGGQLAKPRSAPVELVGAVELPAFRGHMINSEIPSPEARRHDPTRMLRSLRMSRDALDLLRMRRERSGGEQAPGSGLWASHEALVIDYESALVRSDPLTGEVFLSSTHVPWVGERTRNLSGAHVALLGSIRNPVGCKIGPTARPESVVRLCGRLNPGREPGKLSLIVRMGVTAIGEALPPIVRAVKDAGHPVIWMSDPMHGNTVRTTCGLKTRRLPDIAAEVTSFSRVLSDLGEHMGGLHLEVAAAHVTECVGGSVPDEAMLGQRYETLCDPRLNPEQALALIDATM